MELLRQACYDQNCKYGHVQLVFDYPVITEPSDLAADYQITLLHARDLLSVNRIAPDMQKYLQNQTYHHKGDEYFINKVNKINQWRLFEARLIMRYPAVRKILRSIRMALLAPLYQIRLHYRRFWPRGS